MLMQQLNKQKNPQIMKKTIVFALACLSTFGMNAQKKANGTIFITHPAIEVVESFNKAFANGDVDKVASYVTDDFKSYDTSESYPVEENKASLLKDVASWRDNYEYTSLTKQNGAYPDALEYKEDLEKGEVWVQTWERLKGTEKQTGIKIDLLLHRSYIVNKDLKIKTVILYLDSRPFDRIKYSKTERKNGEIYMTHENINTVRKVMAAFENKDFDKYSLYYDESLKVFDINNADFNKSTSLKELIANDKNFHQNFEIVRIEQVGYPDYLHFELMDARVVNSWWNVVLIRKSDKKKMSLPLMLSNDFNAKGKIIAETMYYSQKTLEAK